MAGRLAVTMGAKVTVISRTKNKEEEAKALGAKGILFSSDPQALQASACAFDLIIDAAPVKHDLNIYTPLSDIGGSLVIVGQIDLFDGFSGHGKPPRCWFVNWWYCRNPGNPGFLCEALCLS